MRLVALITYYSVVHCILFTVYSSLYTIIIVFYNDSAVTIINIWTVYLMNI